MLPLQLIGVHLEKFLLLKIKDNAEVAGPSLPLDHWNLSALSLEKDYLTFLNNNWLIVLHHLETKDAMEVWWTMHFNLLLKTVLLLKMLIPIRLLTKHAKLKEETSRSQNSLMLKNQDSWKRLALIWLMLSLNNPYQLVLMPNNGNSTLEVSSQIVKRLWIMVSLPSVMILNKTGSSRTLGEQVGENKDSSDLRKEILVVFATLLAIPLFEEKLFWKVEYNEKTFNILIFNKFSISRLYWKKKKFD